MQAVILAAGLGRRLGKITESDTKCMIPIHGRRLIDRMLDSLADNDIRRVYLVIGYEGDRLRAHVGESWNGMPVSYIENDVFDKTNNIYSLFLAREELIQDDTLLLESDLIFDPTIIADVLENPAPNLAVVDQYQAWMDGTVVQLSVDLEVLRFIPKKHFAAEEVQSYFKTVNIYKFSRHYLESSYVPFLTAYCDTLGRNEYYEQVLRIVTLLETQDLKAHLVDGKQWYEIDDVADLTNAETMFAPQDQLYQGYLSRHGGYWRFPDLKDFCYLVNPYFPTANLSEEMQRSFDVLLREYPSALWVQNMLAGRLLGLDPSYVLVGNGAAELITGLGREFGGKSVGLFVPSFEEYPARFGDSSLEQVAFLEDPSRRSVAGILELAERNDGIILVNPDNPSGAYLTRMEVLEIADELEKSNKFFIVDESFVDFSSEGKDGTLLRTEILEAYPNMVVVKSISKSYGVPGIRLGLIASSNTELLSKVRSGLSVWNINSLGEFFLQIIGKYEPAYWHGCGRLATERARFTSRLEAVEGLQCLPSNANFVMCKITGRSAGWLAARLLERGILIKDLTGKPGIPGNRYVRLAIRDQADNDRLVEALELALQGNRSE